MKVAVIDHKGKDTGRKVELSKDIFGIEPNDHALYLDVKQYLANQRQGTHKSKQRAEIKGSTRKIKKQKGTGTARAGSIKSGMERMRLKAEQEISLLEEGMPSRKMISDAVEE